MSVATVTLGDQWRNQYLVGMTLVHILMHHDIRLVPKEEPTLTGLINILKDIVGGNYIPAKYFKSGISLPPPYIDQPPSLDPKAEYTLISLNALTARGQFVSIKTGGVVFEDPIWALLSAYELRSTRHPKIAIPKANDNQDLWHRVRLVAEAIRQNN